MGPDDNHWCELGFAEQATVFKGPTQNARVLSEGWVAAQMFCPNCGADRLRALPNNSPVADFDCATCAEEYEVKATKGRLGRKVVDGAYGAMTARLAARNNPNLVVMAYDGVAGRVTDLIVVPRYFFVQSLIEARRPLGRWPAARAGRAATSCWVTCLRRAGSTWSAPDCMCRGRRCWHSGARRCLCATRA